MMRIYKRAPAIANTTTTSKDMKEPLETYYTALRFLSDITLFNFELSFLDI